MSGYFIVVSNKDNLVEVLEKMGFQVVKAKDESCIIGHIEEDLEPHVYDVAMQVYEYTDDMKAFDDEGYTLEDEKVILELANML